MPVMGKTAGGRGPANWQPLAQRVANPQETYFVIDNPPGGTTLRFYRAIGP